MINLVRSKIEGLIYSNHDSLKELYKLIGISQFIIEDKSRGCIPPYAECFVAINEIRSINHSGVNKEDFDKAKSELLSVYDKLIAFFNEVDKGPSMSVLLHGQGKVNFSNDLEYEFLMVEQNNLDYFIDKKSHLPSQPYDRLHSHIWTIQDNYEIKFGFIEGSMLPDLIRDQVTEAFHRVVQKYGGQKQ